MRANESKIQRKFLTTKTRSQALVADFAISNEEEEHGSSSIISNSRDRR